MSRIKLERVIKKRGRKVINLAGKKVGTFTALKYVGSKNWLCICDCGSKRIIPGSSFRMGTRSFCENCSKVVIGRKNRVKTLLDRDYVAYIAGIIDGEGAVSLASRGRYITPTIQVTNTNKELIDWLKEKCGGGTYEHKEDRRGNRKAIFLWSVAGQVGRDIIEAVRPFLIVKAKQADVILKSYTKVARKVIRNSAGRLSATLTDSELQANRDAITQIRSLNKRGLNYALN